MDKRKAYPSIKANDFGKSHKDLIDSYTKKTERDIIDRLQEQSNRTLKKLVKENRKRNPEIIKNDIKLTDTNGGNFGEIDEVSKKNGIGQIKTISNEEFRNIIINKGNKQDYSELNALMHKSKISKGYIHYVNQDDPFMQKTIKHKYDISKYTQDLNKVKRVQAFIEDKIIPSSPAYTSSKQMATISETDFASNFARLQTMKDQSIVRAGIKSNNPFIRNMRRENRSLIEGFGHGWGGKMRKLLTPFGSPQRIRNYEDAIGLSSKDVEEIFGESWGLDLESTGLHATPDSIVQAAFKKGKRYDSLFTQRRSGFSLKTDAPFLAQSGFNDAVKGIDFTKSGAIQDYQKRLKSLDPSFSGIVNAQVTSASDIANYVDRFVAEAKASNRAIFIQNPNFEINQLDALYKSLGRKNPLRMSEEYQDMAYKERKAIKGIYRKLKSNEITADQAFSNLLSSQRSRFATAISEAATGGKVVDVQDIGRMLNAVMQEKNLQLRTGRFAANTSIDHLAKIFLNLGEAHEGNLDLHQQDLLAKRMYQSIQEISSGSKYSDFTELFVNSNKLNSVDDYKKSLKKTIISEIEAGKNPYAVKYFDELPVKGIDRFNFFDEVIRDQEVVSKMQGASLKSNGGVNISEANLKKARVGSLLFGGLLLGSAVTNLFTFSGRDDAANTIEGLGHGSPTQNQREKNTSFGSGYRTEKFHQAPQGEEEQRTNTWEQLGYTGLGATGAYAVFKHKAKNTRLNDLSYLGKLDTRLTNEQLLRRTEATAQDVMVAGIRRMESSFGGIGKAFGAGDIASFGMYDSASFKIDLMSKEGLSYARYMNQLLNRKLIEEGVDSIMFRKGQLFARTNDKWQKIEGQFSLLKTVTNHDLSSSISSLAKSALYQKGISNLDDIAKQPFLIIGGKNDYQKYVDFGNAFIHETLSKPMKLLADPLEALREMFPDFDFDFLNKTKKYMNPKYMPDVGLDGKELVTSWPDMVKKHGAKLATFGALAYYGLGTLHWGAQTLAPDGTPIGDAGLVGGGAYAVRKAHELYARFSDITGLTSLRDYIEEKAPGSDGWQSTLGLTAAGAMFGGLYGGIQDLTAEGTAVDKYAAFLERKKKTEKFDGKLGKIFKGEFTKTGKAMRIGGLAGFIAALPYTIAGLGADSSASQLAAEYSGEKEVAVRKGRFWESGFTPFEGGEIDYYRPNWYAKLMSDAKDKELFGENISPLTETFRAITDPYWLEKARYHSQPYPITGPDGSGLGIFGPIYEASIGRIIKPVATMHASVLPEELLDNTEYDAEAMLRKQWNATLEFMGLRGFAVKAIKENLTGSQEIFADPDEARSAKDIDSVVRDFYDLQIGGGILTSEAIRRVFQNQDSFQKAQLGASINLNPLKNTMPSWMPGSDYVTDFKSGDPFLKVKDGYYRLPGEGFASRYEELEGVNPEYYADIYKYKILADIGYGSKEFRMIKGKLQNRELTNYEQSIYNQVEEQIREKKESEMNVRDPSTYDSFLGRYSAMVTDLARSNPLETLLPVSPAHKFLGPPDIEDYMDEQKYSKDYRSWSNPIDDFILPAVSMTMNSMGMGGISMNDDQSEVDNYFDKVEYVKYSNLAREAQSKGDLRSADKYTLMAQKTYSGKNLYTHHADVASALPASERRTFNYFVGADVATKQRMMTKVNPRYRDAYQAQLDMQMMQEIQNSNQNRAQQARVMKEIRQRQRYIEAQRQANIQDAKQNMPDSKWRGWDSQSSLASIKKGYLENRARDYHDYQPRRNSRQVEADRIAAGDIPENLSGPASYSSHYTDLNNAGVQNALVVLRPGLDNEAIINVKVDRRKERDEAFRSWGYIK
jgi:hypothetical protein